MKNLLAIVAILGFTFITGFSQNGITDLNNLKSFTDKHTTNLSDLNTSKSTLGVEARFCTENWGLDSLGNFGKQSEGEILFESLGNNRFKMSQALVFGEDDDAQDVLLVGFFNGQPDFQGEINLDSTIFYFVEGDENVLFSKVLYSYDDGLLVKEESYTDYSLFGFPAGLVLSDHTIYRYDNNKFLTSEAYYSFSFIDQSIDFYDSTDYVNNAKGMPDESYYYDSGFSGELVLNTKKVYTYNNNDLLIKEESYYSPSNWTISDRTTSQYLTKINVEFDEVTYDAGATWNPVSRDSTYFTENLPFNYFNRISTEIYEENQWVLDEVIIIKDCSGSSVNEIEELDFSVNIINNDLNIFSLETINDANVRLFNMNGQVLFNKNYNIVPELINLNNIKSGVYLIEIIGTNHRGIKKVIKI